MEAVARNSVGGFETLDLAGDPLLLALQALELALATGQRRQVLGDESTNGGTRFGGSHSGCLVHLV
jgi:hypothetical protein